MSKNLHTKIINKIAAEILGSIGAKRKGQSRIWLDDNGWWVTVVEFQPSGFSKGTYLNVAINFQWYPNKNYSFDIFNREASFIEYLSDEQFEPKIRELAELAKTKILGIRERLASPEALKGFVHESFREISSMWSEFHQGMACIAAGDTNNGITYFKRLLEDSHDTNWGNELKSFTQDLVNIIQSGGNYLMFINSAIDESRKLKKLKPIEAKLFSI